MQLFLTCSLVILSSTCNCSENPRHNEASRDNSDIWLVIILCFLFCFALRHANDFYHGETVTLVKEGEYGRRFCRRVRNKHLQQIENDFNDMFQKLCEKQDKELDEEGCSGYYEEKRGTRLYN
ncbi:unnamed protein product [Caenorhabditis bovis]|uniref:DUF19 domain-containing protein n=1 Tax=Caenorhabditis bovis TaxID=2654633 RepID=A0A8S1EEW0_9PELO|nr:unnamed protein product [Caenorhabditis bovis]